MWRMPRFPHVSIGRLYAQSAVQLLPNGSKVLHTYVEIKILDACVSKAGLEL